MRRSKSPQISIIIISYNMAREVPRTVQSFLPPYQNDLSPDEIEIIVLENGSSNPIPKSVRESWPENVRYIKVENPHPSPAKALNQGVEMARGEWVCPVIDGARMVSPGVINAAKAMMKAHENPVIATIGYHLGHKTQQINVDFGYNQEEEDKLLDSINWPDEPYKLFEISSLGGSAKAGWLQTLMESNVPFMKKSFYQSISGFDEAFDIPGGGLVNLDFFKRCVEHPETQYVLLLGEASFHQYHGGVTTSRRVGMPSQTVKGKTTWEVYSEQYEAIRGASYKGPTVKPIIYGEHYEVARSETIRFAKTVLES